LTLRIKTHISEQKNICSCLELQDDMIIKRTIKDYYQQIYSFRIV